MAASLLVYIGSQIWAIKEVLPGIATYRLEKKKAQSATVAAKRKALNRTRVFFKNPDFSNTEELTNISDLWSNASEKVGVIDSHLGRILGDKSRFWSDHELFVALGREKDIISLNDVVSEIDKLYNKM